MELNNTKAMELPFRIPQKFIAIYPNKERRKSKLLFASQYKDRCIIEDTHFYNIANYLREGDVLVMNHTRVSPRRVFLHRENGGSIEALFLSHGHNQINRWQCLVKGRKKLRANEVLHTKKDGTEFIYIPDAQNKDYLEAQKNDKPAWQHIEEARAWFEANGIVPIPPYLKRASIDLDKIRYQTVYARKESAYESVAAPTAGLHFDENLISEIKQKVRIVPIELQISYGTFAPLSEENFKTNTLHKEKYFISEHAAKTLNDAIALKKNGGTGRIIAVGTTSLRAMEANFRKHGDAFEAEEGETDLFIRPPDSPKTIDGIITNFHLSPSSLLLLVASFTGQKDIERIYKHAIDEHYKFYSYGDAMLYVRS